MIIFKCFFFLFSLQLNIYLWRRFEWEGGFNRCTWETTRLWLRVWAQWYFMAPMSPHLSPLLRTTSTEWMTIWFKRDALRSIFQTFTAPSHPLMSYSNLFLQEWFLFFLFEFFLFEFYYHIWIISTFSKKKMYIISGWDVCWSELTLRGRGIIRVTAELEPQFFCCSHRFEIIWFLWINA